MIELKNISKTIRGTEIIKNVSVKFETGIVTGIRGTNGSGKTMLMRLIAGLIKPTTGEIIIDGEMLWKDIAFPKSIGILIENPAFIDYYSGLENLKLLASIQKRVNEEYIRDTLISVGLNPDDPKEYKCYSLGMKQRLGIAAAIMESPDIILLDEPTNALDADGLEMMKHIILGEKTKGKTIVISCHDQQTLEYLSDKIFHIEEGQIKNTSKGGEQA